MKAAKLENFSYTRLEDSASFSADMAVLLDDSDPTNIIAYAAPPPGAEQWTPSQMKQEIGNVLVERNDALLEEIEKFKGLMSQKDELIAQLAKQLKESHEQMLRMYDLALEKVEKSADS